MRRYGLAAALWLFAAAAAPAQEMIFFRSPTGNIACMLYAGADWRGARCDLREATPSFARRPQWCDLDWGFAFTVTAGGIAEPACVGDSVADPSARVLPYGASLSLGGVTCTSERTGMTCVNRQGRGFSVARAAQRVF